MYFISKHKFSAVFSVGLLSLTADAVASNPLSSKQEFTEFDNQDNLKRGIVTRSAKRKQSFESPDSTPSKLQKLNAVAPSPIKQQVFARTTYDSTAKYILGNDDIRLDFIKTFTGLNVKSSTPLDDSLNPLHGLTNARELFSNPNTKNFIAAVKEAPESFTVAQRLPGTKRKIEFVKGSQFIREFSNYYKDVVTTFPKERASQVDVLCKLSDENFALVEIQVMKQTKWDERALFYASSIYSNQLPSGGKWEDLRAVYAINILGGGPNNVTYWNDDKNKSAAAPKPVRHYQFTDIHNKANVIPGIQLFQYSLGDADLESLEFQEKVALHNWLDFFKNAHRKVVTPPNISKELEQAYEMVRLKNLPSKVKDMYDQEKHDFEIYADHEKSVRLASEKKGREEGEKIGIEKGRQEGIEKGIELGKMRGLYELIVAKRQLKRLPEQIADALDITIERMNEIIKTVEDIDAAGKTEEIL